MDLNELRDYARTFPSQGGVEIGPWLERYAAAVPPGSAIVEVGCWLGAGTAHLALGALQSKAAIHVFDRWRFDLRESEKAERYGLAIHWGEDTLPRVRGALAPFPVDIFYYKGSIKEARWNASLKIGLYVDDASKGEAVWQNSMRVFSPAFIARVTILVLMDWHFDEKAGPQYAAQKRWMALHKDEFDFIEERMGGTTAAVFRFLGTK